MPRFNSVPTLAGNWRRPAGKGRAPISSLPRRSFSTARPNRRRRACRRTSTARSNRAIDFGRIAAERGHRRAALIEVFGRLLDRARQLVEHFQGLLEVLAVAMGFGRGQRTIVAVVAGVLAAAIRLDRLVVLAERELALADDRNGPARRRRPSAASRSPGDSGRAELADAQPHGGGGRAVLAGFQLGDRVAEGAELADSPRQSTATSWPISRGPNVLFESTMSRQIDANGLRHPSSDSMLLRRRQAPRESAFSKWAQPACAAKSFAPATRKSQRWESNPQPPHYECGALPIEATLACASPLVLSRLSDLSRQSSQPTEGPKNRQAPVQATTSGKDAVTDAFSILRPGGRWRRLRSEMLKPISAPRSSSARF